MPTFLLHFISVLKLLYLVVSLDYFSSFIRLFPSFQVDPFVSVENIMLEHEYKIKDHRDNREKELNNVESARTCEVKKWLTLIPVVEGLLNEREESTAEIEHDVG